MNTGQIISGAGHLGLIGWALVGNIFAAEPIPFEVTEVTAITEEEFAALTAAQQPPATVSDISAPQVPQVPEEAPGLSSQVDVAPEQPAPDAAQPADPDPVPKDVQTTPPAEADVSDEAPVLTPPEPQDFAALVPEISVRPKPRPVERVAPEQVAQPEPDTAVDDTVQQETAPSKEADTQAPEQEATAPEEAATEIVTEAEQAAPSKSVRPKARPTRADPPQDTQTAKVQADNGGVNAALAAALGGEPDASQEPASSVPQLSSGEIDALHVAVGSCWNVDPGSAASRVTVTLKVELNEQGRPTGSPRLMSNSGGDSSAIDAAYRAARTAIIACGRKGFDLPAEKYERWKVIEMTFNPEKMRIK